MNLNKSKEDYLKHIFLLLETQSEPIKTTTLSERLKVSPAAVTDQTQKLSAAGYIKYLKYKGVLLTNKGHKVGKNMVRRHRILELFLHQILSLSWDTVHAEAERLEHAVSDTLINQMEIKLGFPQFDPHGDPIPSIQGVIPCHNEGVLLSQTRVGQMYEVARVLSDGSDFLNYLDKVALSIGQKLEVSGHHEFDHSVVVIIQKRPITLSQFTASQVVVSPVKILDKKRSNK